MSGREPVEIAWQGGVVEAGYLGRHRWRCRSASGVVEVSDTSAAVEQLLAAVFAGVAAGDEVRSRAPLLLRLGEETGSLVRDWRMFNGWSHVSARFRFDIGDHAELHAWLTQWLRSSAESLWAPGVTPPLVAAIPAEFSFAAFLADPDPASRCRALEAILAQRLAESPHPPSVLERAALELRSLGHDLWSWDPDRLWGADYVTRREGAGLTLALYGEDEDDDEAPGIEVEFSPSPSERGSDPPPR